MFFSGDASSRRKVDLSGRSKQPDRQKVLEQARLERERRQRVRLENQSALRIQSFYRGRSLVAKERSRIRADWQASYGEFGELANSEGFWTDRNFVLQLIFFTRPSKTEDVQCLASACNLLLASFNNTDAHEKWPVESQRLWLCRLQRLALLCLQSVHHHRHELRSELLQTWPTPKSHSGLATTLLETLVELTAKEAWTFVLLKYLVQHRMFAVLRDLLLLQEVSATSGGVAQRPQLPSAVEYVGHLLVVRYLDVQGNNGGIAETQLPLHLRLSVQLGSIPFLWDRGTLFLQSPRIWSHMVESLNGVAADLDSAISSHVIPSTPSKAYLLGNVLAGSSTALAHPSTTAHTAICFAGVAKQLLEALATDLLPRNDDAEGEGEIDDALPGKGGLPEIEPALEKQMSHVADSSTLQHLVRLTMPVTGAAGLAERKDGKTLRNGVELCQSLEEAAVGFGAACALLDTAMVVLPRLRTVMITGLAWQARLVPRLWAYIRACHLQHVWWLPAAAAYPNWDAGTNIPLSWLGWMLPLALFCPVYCSMLFTTDNEEFYELQTPLSLADLPILVEVLRDAIWQLLWASGGRSTLGTVSSSRLGPERLKQHVGTVAARLLAQLHDRNCQREFIRPEHFHAPDGLDDGFYSQAEQEGTKARQLLQEAPFLVPFPGRVRIFTNLLEAVRAESGQSLPYGGIRITIRRDRIVEDSFAQLHSLPLEVLRGKIRVQYVNELGAEEAGVDGGGMFKDFLENITRAAFDVQYGLFKETHDHLLYPNPASDMVMTNHLQYFEFVGRILGKALYEGILVDIRFARFFLSKLRNKHNHLHDLPSLDPEIYRSLMFLKNYEGDVAELELFFVVEDTAFGQMMQVELIPGGKDIPVTSQNVIRYVWHVANHHLNKKIQHQSRAFLNGFQDVVPANLLAMFNEQEVQMLISGSEEGLDLEDLRKHAIYSGGYSEDHPVIRGLWAVLLSFNSDQQHQFLKFVTGCSRGPLLGFRHLEPPFCVQRAAGDGANMEVLERLPTSATCLNLLKLPPYKSTEALRKKLLYAITAGAGFDLS